LNTNKGMTLGMAAQLAEVRERLDAEFPYECIEPAESKRETFWTKVTRVFWRYK
jgi:hypothetical protein